MCLWVLLTSNTSKYPVDLHSKSGQCPQLLGNGSSNPTPGLLSQNLHFNMLPAGGPSEIWQVLSLNMEMAVWPGANNLTSLTSVF